MRKKGRRLIRKVVSISLIISTGLLAGAACTGAKPGPVQTVAVVPTSTQAVIGVDTNAPSPVPGPVSTRTPVVRAPTFPPDIGKATRTLPASATPDTSLYVIENDGKPHFIEFHAWW